MVLVFFVGCQVRTRPTAGLDDVGRDGAMIVTRKKLGLRLLVVAGPVGVSSMVVDACVVIGGAGLGSPNGRYAICSAGMVDAMKG